MTYPWEGAARRLTDADVLLAAREINVDAAVIKAVWQAESAGRPFRSDGTLERRYEPHHFPGSGVTNWRDSLKLSTATRERMFAQAYSKDPEAALRATSVGGPQIMGFNYALAGFRSAVEMTKAMADSEKAQLAGFIGFVRSKGLVPTLQRKDWLTFAKGYNGSGQAPEYAKRLRAAYAGQSSQPVLRLGSSGPAVKRAQAALGILDDGIYGGGTRDAVKAFQRANGLPDDGVVGPDTWAALEESAKTVAVAAAKPRDASPETGLAAAIIAIGAAIAAWMGFR